MHVPCKSRENICTDKKTSQPLVVQSRSYIYLYFLVQRNSTSGNQIIILSGSLLSSGLSQIFERGSSTVGKES